MKLYHNTFASEEILSEGFKDGEGRYLTTETFRGVFLSNTPLDINEGADGDTLLSIEIPEEVIAEFEWIEDGKPYREWCIPAKTVNRYGPPKVVIECLNCGAYDSECDC
jgi:hypothetical protein